MTEAADMRLRRRRGRSFAAQPASDGRDQGRPGPTGLVGRPHAAVLKALGNGVVPQQAYEPLRRALL